MSMYVNLATYALGKSQEPAQSAVLGQSKLSSGDICSGELYLCRASVKLRSCNIDRMSMNELTTVLIATVTEPHTMNNEVYDT